MKITKTFLALAFSGLLMASCKETAKEPDTAAAASELNTHAVAAKVETASFSIEGMSCSVGCAKTIEKKLAGLDGVQKASVDFDAKTATVEYDAAKQSPEELIQVVESAADGNTYKVSDVKNSGDKAMVYGDPVKDKKKKKKAKKDAEAKAAGCADEKAGDKTGAKAGCCASKKACHDEKGTL